MSVSQIIIDPYMNQPRLIVYKYKNELYVPLTRAVKLYFNDTSQNQTKYVRFTRDAKKRPMEQLACVRYGTKMLRSNTAFCTLDAFCTVFRACSEKGGRIVTRRALSDVEKYIAYLLSFGDTPSNKTDNQEQLNRMEAMIRASYKRCAIDELKRTDPDIKRVAEWINKNQFY